MNNYLKIGIRVIDFAMLAVTLLSINTPLGADSRLTQSEDLAALMDGNCPDGATHTGDCTYRINDAYRINDGGGDLVTVIIKT